MPAKAADHDDRITVRELHRATRGLFALVGMAGLFAGAVAVFETENQAGTVALLAVGSIASLLAVVGKVPLRWVIGGHEFDMSEKAARTAAEVMASHLPPSETAELAEQMAQAEYGRLSAMTSAMLEHANFERRAIELVVAVVRKRGWSYVDASGRDRGADGWVVTPGGGRVPIEYKLVRTHAGILTQMKNVIQRYDYNHTRAVVVVMSGPPLSPRRAEMLRLLGPTRLIAVPLDEADFERRFADAVDEALRLEQTPEEYGRPDHDR